MWIKGKAMSENWGHYVADMEGHIASVVFDEGIAKSIKSLPENISYLVTATLQEMNDDRMPTDAEAERLEALSDDLDELFKEAGGYSVGRVTSNGKRHHFFYTNQSSEDQSNAIYKIGLDLGYELTGGSRDDPEKEAYFEELYPDPESRQVMNDMNLIGVLLEKGDNIQAERLVDHMSVFQTRVAAQSYMKWAESAGYQVDPIRKEGLFLKKSFYVESHNVTSVSVYDINPHTLGHFRKALEFGGEYDGWGCTIVPSSDT